MLSEREILDIKEAVTQVLIKKFDDHGKVPLYAMSIIIEAREAIAKVLGRYDEESFKR